MSFEFFKNIVDDVKKLDGEVNDYKSIAKNPAMPSIAYVNWAIHLAESGHMKEAEEKLLSSTLMAHQTPEAYINLGVLKIKERKFEEAIKLYSRAIRLDSNSAKAYCFLANALTEMKDFQDAERKFKQALKIDPNNSDILLNWGISLVRQRKFVQAKEKFQQACKFNTPNLNAIYFLGLIDIELNEEEKAKEKFSLIVSVIPTHYEAFYYLAYIYFREGNYEKSLTYALSSIEIFNRKTETYMLIGENYMSLEKEEECLKAYEDGAKLCITTYFFLISWGISLQKFGHYEESKSKFNQAIEMDSKNDLAHAYLGIAHYKLNDYDKAIVSLNCALEINPSNAVVLDTLGQIQFDREDYKGAVKYYSSVLKHNVKLVDNYAKIANAYFLDGNISKANEFYQRALEYQPNNASIYVDFAKILIEQKDYQAALKKLMSAYKLDDDNLDCLNLLFYVNYTLAKETLCDYNMESAIEFARIIEKNYPDAFVYKDEKHELESRQNSRKQERQ